MEILYAGVNIGSGNGEVKFNGVCGAIAIRCNTGSTATVYLDGRNDHPFTIKSVDLYDILPVTASKIQVTSGAIDFIAFA